MIAAWTVFFPHAQAQNLFSLPEDPFTSSAAQLKASKQRLAGTLTLEEFKVLSEGFIAGTALLNQTGDHLGSLTSLNNGTFFDISGGTSRYNTGSHVDLTSFSLLTGLSRQVKLAQGPMTIGAFFEYGDGEYDTFNLLDTPLLSPYFGNGSVHHYGGGLLGRVDFRNSGLYTEGSFRAGSMRNEFGSADLGGAGYDSSSPYLGMHLGLGSVQHISNKTSLDLYSKYFWMQQDSDTITLSSGDSVLFRDTNSHRLQLGGRVNNAVNSQLKTYWGAAWGQEFAGTVREAGGFFFGGPALKGGTVLGELGVTWKPMKNGGLFLDFGVQGYFGKREGFAAGLQLRWQRLGMPQRDCRTD